MRFHRTNTRLFFNFRRTMTSDLRVFCQTIYGGCRGSIVKFQLWRLCARGFFEIFRHTGLGGLYIRNVALGLLARHAWQHRRRGWRRREFRLFLSRHRETISDRQLAQFHDGHVHYLAYYEYVIDVVRNVLRVRRIFRPVWVAGCRSQILSCHAFGTTLVSNQPVAFIEFQTEIDNGCVENEAENI